MGMIKNFSKRVVAWIVSALILLSIIPVGLYTALAADSTSLGTNIGDIKFYVGETKEFTFTSYASPEDADKMVIITFELYDGDVKIDEGNKSKVLNSLEYRDDTNECWSEFYGSFGPATGFPLTNGVTSRFQANFKESGEYRVVVSVVCLPTENEAERVLTSIEETVTVQVTNCELDTTIDDVAFELGESTEFTYTTVAGNREDEYVLGTFTLVDAYGNDAKGAVEELQYKDDANGIWLDFYGDFGPAEVGFPLTDGATSQFRVKFNKTGVYTVKVGMKNINTDIILCSHETTIKVDDTTAPVVEVTGAPENWTNTDAKITVNATDNGEIVGYCVNDGKWQEINEFPIGENGTYIFKAKDSFGNIGESSLTIDKIDKVKPVATVSLEYEAKDSETETTNKNVIITVNATDEGSGVAKYTFNGADYVYETDKVNQITVSDEADYVLTVTDNAGSVSSEIKFTTGPDETSPTINNIEYSTDWVADKVVLAVEAEDAGCNVLQYSIDGENYSTDKEIAVTENGTYTVFVKDAWGNVAEQDVEITNIDKTAPEISFDDADFVWVGESKDAIWVDGNVEIKGTVTETESGVGEFYYTNGENGDKIDLEVKDGFFTLNQKLDSDTTYYFYCVDNVGRETSEQIVVKVDTEAPALSYKYETDIWETIKNVFYGFAVDELKVSVSVGDNSSGLDKVEYATSVESNTYTTITPGANGEYSFSIKAQYRDSVKVRAIDRVGKEVIYYETYNNNGKKEPVVMVVDNNNPVITAKYITKNNTIEDNGGVFYTEDDVDIVFTIAEENYDLAEEPIVTVEKFEIVTDTENETDPDTEIVPDTGTVAQDDTDNGNVQKLKWTYNEENNEWVSEAIPLIGEGGYKVRVEFKDRSGNNLKLGSETFVKTETDDESAEEDDSDSETGSEGNTSSGSTSSDATSSDVTSSDVTSSDVTSSGATSSETINEAGTEDNTSSDATSSDIIGSDGEVDVDEDTNADTGTEEKDTVATIEAYEKEIHIDGKDPVIVVEYLIDDESAEEDDSDSETGSEGNTSSGSTSSDATSSGSTSSDATSSGATSSDATSSDATSSGATSSDATSSDVTSSDATSSGATSSDTIGSDTETGEDTEVKTTYYKSGTVMRVKIIEHNFNAEDVDLKLTAKDICGNDVPLTGKDGNVITDQDGNVITLASYLVGYIKDASNWKYMGKDGELTDDATMTENPDNHYIDLPALVDAVYNISGEELGLNYTDLAGNPAAEWEDEYTVDGTGPENIEIKYNQKTSLLDILGSFIFFLKPSVTVTVEMTDNTSGVDFVNLLYTDIEDEPKNETEPEKEVEPEKLKVTQGESNNKFTAKFDIEKELQGKFSVEVFDKAGNSSVMNDDTLIIADKTKPGISVNYLEIINGVEGQSYGNHPITGNIIDECNYFKSNVAATITIDEANFYEGQIVDKFTDEELKTEDRVETEDQNQIEDQASTIDETVADGNTETEPEETTEVIHTVGILLTKTYNNDVTTEIEYVPEGSKKSFYNADKTVEFSWTDGKDSNTHTFTIDYTDNADYKLEVKYKDLSGNEATGTYNATVDKIAPEFSISYDNYDEVNTIDFGKGEIREYYDDPRTATIKITEHYFNAEDVALELTARDICGNDVNITDQDGKVITLSKYLSDYIQDASNWKYMDKYGELTDYVTMTKNPDDHYIVLPYDVEANYTFDIKYEDFAKNSIEDRPTEYFTFDESDPECVEVKYSNNVFQNILNHITFGYYNAKMKVEIYAKDDVAGIHHFKYSYLNNQGVSNVNAQLINEAISSAAIEHIKGTNIFKTTFEIPKLALKSDNQFNGMVEFTAYDRCEHESDTFKDEKNVLVVDNIKPTAQVSFNDPVQKVDDVSYYAGDINASIVINEANFFSEEVEIIVTKDGNNYPVNVNWTDNSVDVHTGTFTLSEDGDYIVNVAYNDRSKNEMIPLTSNQLTIDTKDPVITVSNVKHQSANNQETINFTVSVTDVNIALNSFKPTLTAVVKKEAGENSYTYETVTIPLGDAITTVNANGETVHTYTISNIDVDGFYSLVCDAVDYANHSVSIINSDAEMGGTATVEAMNFSVNREGSVFWIETEHNDKYNNKTFTNELNGKYANDSVTVKLHEVNVDKVDENSEKKTVFTLNDGSESEDIRLVEKVNGVGNYDKNVSVGSGGWYENIYTLNDENFNHDGVYSLNVITYDTANNSNVNTKNESGNISFTVDRTDPKISANVKSKQRVNDTEFWVEFEVTEANLNEETVVVKLTDNDGKTVNAAVQPLGNNEYKFKVDSGYNYSLAIEAKDLAGNASEIYDVERFTVTTNVLILWYANTPLFWGSIGIAALLAGSIFLIIFLKKKKKNEQAN